MEDKLKNYIYDLCFLIKEKAIEAKQDKDAASIGEKEYEFKLGYLMAFHEVISLLKQEAFAFDINQKDLGLSDINPEIDLL